jgi:hypothetical protein
VARAMALPVFFGMFVELVSLFVVPVLYCGYMEMRLNLGLKNPAEGIPDTSDLQPTTSTGAIHV